MTREAERTGPAVGTGADERTALLLRALSSDVAMVLTDPHRPDEPIVWANDAFYDLTGYGPEDVLGHNCRFLQGPDTDRAEAERLRKGASLDRTLSVALLNHRRDGTPFWNQLIVSPVRDDEGRVTHRLGVQVDVTDRVQLEQLRSMELELLQQTTVRLDLLARVSDALVAQLDYDAAIDSLADVAVPPLAPWGFVVTVDERGRLDHLHLASRDPAVADHLRALEAEPDPWLEGSTPLRKALAADDGHVARPFVIDVAGTRERVPADQLEHLLALGLGSALVVPLRARDRVMGVLCLVSDRTDGFDAGAVVTAAHLGRRAGLTLDNVRLYLAERTAALTLQHSLLPEIPRIEGLDVAATYLPSAQRAEVGGDWFDVLPLPSGRVGLAVGDVVGHDLRAAAGMGQLRSMLRSAVWREPAPGQALAGVDDLVRALDIGAVATCVYLTWQDGPDGTLVTWANAGHPPALVRHADGRVERLTGALSRPVGLGPLDGGDDGTAVLEPGAVLVVHTDGLVERRARPLSAGLAELVRALEGAPAGATSAQVRDHLITELVADRPEDDVCLLVVQASRAG